MATVEYVALAVLVSIVLVVGGALAGAPAIGEAVGAQIRRALCIVQSGDCNGRHGPQPCVVGTRSEQAQWELRLLLARLRDGRVALLEELSDGTFRVTETRSNGGGASAEIGAKLRLAGLNLDASVEGEAGVDVSSARTFVVANRDAAKTLLARLEEDGPPVGEAMTGLVRFIRGGAGADVERTVAVKGTAEAQGALEALGLGPNARLVADLTGSLRVNRQTGDVGLGLRLDRQLGAELDVLLAGASGTLVGSAQAELVLDRHRRPRELVLRASGEARGSARLMSGGVAGGNLRDVEARLDLTPDAESAALAGRILAGEAGAVAALARRAGERARIDVRHYATKRKDDAQVGSVLNVGVGHEEATETARLVAAEGREPGRGWARRLDCVVA